MNEQGAYIQIKYVADMSDVAHHSHIDLEYIFQIAHTQEDVRSYGVEVYIEDPVPYMTDA